MPTNVYDQAARYAAKLDPTGFLAWLLAGIWHLVEFAGWLDTRTLPYPGECMLPWIPLMRGADDPQTAQHWKRTAAAEPDSRRRSDYVTATDS